MLIGGNYLQNREYLSWRNKHKKKCKMNIPFNFVVCFAQIKSGSIIFISLCTLPLFFSYVKEFHKIHFFLSFQHRPNLFLTTRGIIKVKEKSSHEFFSFINMMAIIHKTAFLSGAQSLLLLFAESDMNYFPFNLSMCLHRESCKMWLNAF